MSSDGEKTCKKIKSHKLLDINSENQDKILSELVRKLGSIKGRITSFAKHVESLQNLHISAIQVQELIYRLENINSVYEEFNNVHSKIDEMSDDIDIENQFRQNVEDKYFNVIAIAKCIITDNKDNGKNFVGALKHLADFLTNNSHKIIDFASNNNIKFTFIPPYAPHFGGLWEAGVKSCKHHLRRIMGNAHLPFEELSTILTQIEAVLNSRPISPLSTDPTDPLPLTPAHFLIGRPLTSHARDDVTSTPAQRLPRFDRMEQIRQHFWQRWSKEYISELQLRTKWKFNKDDIKIDQIVIIKEDNMPPLKWRLGRIVKVYPGKDGVSRVAYIRTQTGDITRAFNKICPLPVNKINRTEEERT